RSRTFSSLAAMIWPAAASLMASATWSRVCATQDCMRAINASRDSLGVESMTRSSVRERDLVYLDQFLQIAPGKFATPVRRLLARFRLILADLRCESPRESPQEFTPSTSPHPQCGRVCPRSPHLLL